MIPHEPIARTQPHDWTIGVSDRDFDIPTLRRITAERRAEELVRALRNAVAGAPHWRFEAARLLELIDAGVLPDRASNG